MSNQNIPGNIPVPGNIPSDYLADLDSGLLRLRNFVNQTNKMTSGDFNKTIIEKIGSIDQKLVILRQQALIIVARVKELKERIDNDNRNYTTNKDELQKLKQEMETLTQEKGALQGEITRITTGQSSAAAELNNQIQEKNSKIEELTQEMEKREKKFMDQQKKQSEDFTAKDEQKLQQIQELNQQIEQAKQVVLEREAKLAQLNDQMVQAIQQKQSEINELRSVTGNVSQEMEQLKNENKMLIEKIIYSSNVISRALNVLEEIRRKSNTSNFDDIDKKIKDTNAVIDDITAILTGETSVAENTPQNIGGKRRKKMRGGFIANYDMNKNRKSRKTSTNSRSSSSLRSNKKKSRKHKKRSSGFGF